MTTTQELLKSSFELNLNNYGPEDVERLNDWAINAYAALEALQAEVKHLNLHLKATQSGRDAVLARLSKIERQEPVAEMTLVDMGIGDARQLRVNWLMDGYLDVGAKLYASAGASPVEPNFCESCAMGLSTCDCVTPRPVFVNQLPSAQPCESAEHRDELAKRKPEPRPTEDALWDETLKDRDAYHQFADDLAAQIAEITGVDIGEHSSANNPWQEAMLAADDFIATQLQTMLLQQTQPSQAQPPAPAQAASGAPSESLSDVQRQAFIKGWDHRGMAHELKGSVETDDRMRVLMGVFYPRVDAAPSDTAITYMTGYSDGREWAKPSQALVVELVAAANKDAVLQASIDFIRELTGMEPPPIEVAPPETFQPFKTFADKVCAIFATPQAAAQPPAPSEAAREYMTGYSDAKEWAGATSQAQPERAPSDDPLQGAVDWFLQADGECFCVAKVQRTLRIGYNRAQRLCDIAKERAAHGIKQGGQQ